MNFQMTYNTTNYMLLVKMEKENVTYQQWKVNNRSQKLR